MWKKFCKKLEINFPIFFSSVYTFTQHPKTFNIPRFFNRLRNFKRFHKISKDSMTFFNISTVLKEFCEISKHLIWIKGSKISRDFEVLQNILTDLKRFYEGEEFMRFQ